MRCCHAPLVSLHRIYIASYNNLFSYQYNCRSKKMTVMVLIELMKSILIKDVSQQRKRYRQLIIFFVEIDRLPFGRSVFKREGGEMVSWLMYQHPPKNTYLSKRIAQSAWMWLVCQ